jgi:hypothetical protein
MNATMNEPLLFFVVCAGILIMAGFFIGGIRESMRST